MLRVTLEQWRMFRAVVEYGGFNQAAKEVHKSQSSIHTAVHKIEECLGVKLFRVEGRRTLLTEAGEMMLRRANYLLEEAAKVEAVGQTLGEGVESQLRIAVDEIFPQQVLYKVLENTSAQYPLLRVELVESVLTGASELLQNTDVDIAISPVTLQDGFSEELCQIEFIAVANPNHALHQFGRALTFEDLKSHRQIVVRDSAISRKKDEGWLGAHQRWTVSHMTTSIDMIAQGLGFAWLPIPAIKTQLDSGVLKPLPLSQHSQRKAQLHLIFKDGDRLGPAARAFIGELRYQCMQLEYSAE
ncbi:LysR family transcriptional regulator [Pseudoalteromonas piscicida]|uniref:LysR family transcriptional regulator n=1 Tax=Pseudoalteromonas piscicida TaxID=43662 RepID=UPI0032C10ADD